MTKQPYRSPKTGAPGLSRRHMLRLVSATALVAVASSGSAFAQAASRSVVDDGRADLVRQLVDRLDPERQSASPDTFVVDLSDESIRWSDIIARFGSVELEVDKDRSARFGLAFEPGSATPGTRGLELLSIVADALESSQLVDYAFLIGGHTDASGSEDANLELSQRRAETVRRILIERFGLDRRRLVARGFGETRLLLPQEPEHFDNRHIELALVVGAPGEPQRVARGADDDDAYGPYDDPDYDPSFGDRFGAFDADDDFADRFARDRRRDVWLEDRLLSQRRERFNAMRLTPGRPVHIEGAWHSGTSLLPPGARPWWR